MKRNLCRAMLLGLVALFITAVAHAQNGPPRRQVPPAVLTELAVLENRFDAALAADCDGRQCFSKGCTYVAHAVSDRPPSSSMPGLGGELGPSATDAQAWLTQARCAFAYEAVVEPDDVQALVRRLQAKVSTGWVQVTVAHQALEPLPPHLREPPLPAEEPAEEDEGAVAPVSEPWTAGGAARELWLSLLDDFYWMIGLGLLTLAGTTLIWAWRRIGRDSFEERALLAQLAAEGEGSEAEEGDTPLEAAGPDRVEARQAAWSLKMRVLDPQQPDPEIRAMLRELLLAGELPLLAKAVLTFPDTLPAAFPEGADVAPAKLRLAEYLKQVDPETLPTDAQLHEALDRQALAATLATQPDAEMIRSVQQDFGAAGLVGLIGQLGGRGGALLFALAPETLRHEVARLLPANRAAELADELMRSNRMDPSETAHLFEVLEAARAGRPLPEAPDRELLPDHGVALPAAAALSTLLDRVGSARRAQLFGRALTRFGGNLPSWYRGLVTAEMLLQLQDEARTDLLLGVEAEGLAAWISLQDPEVGPRLLANAPNALRESVRSLSGFSSREEQLAHAERGRVELARGLQAQLARLQRPFEEVVQNLAGGGG